MTSLMAFVLLVALAPQDRPDAGPDSLKGQIFQESKPVDIRSDSLKIFHKERYGMFSGHVVADRRDVQLHCDELRAEYDEKGLVERLICNGNVRVVMGRKEAQGRKAVMSNVEELITITGDPSLKDGEDFMQGEVVVFDLARDTVQVEKPRGKYKTRPREEKPGAPPAKK
jgi:lipopolysaccharide export system protein LptA